MRLIHKLKAFERAIVYLRWATDEEFGRIKYVGEDFIEFEILDMDEMQFSDCVLINSQLILEVVISGFEISKIIAEVSAGLPSPKELDI
ncbi:hypothetical protein IJC60_03780 [bacterium]|nr:hypothetical protein [bacterium]